MPTGITHAPPATATSGSFLKDTSTNVTWTGTLFNVTGPGNTVNITIPVTANTPLDSIFNSASFTAYPSDTLFTNQAANCTTGITHLPITPTTWIVDANGTGDFTTIQAAINAANDGDTILVKSGTYYENVIVNKTVSLVGEDCGSIIDGQGKMSVVMIHADNVTLTGFTVRNSTISYGGGYPAIDCYHFYNGAISGNLIEENYIGIALDYSSNDLIFGNNITQNDYAGIVLDGSTSNNVFQNNIHDNLYDAISFMSSYWNNIFGNNLTNNEVGVDISDWYAAANNFTENNIANNHIGIIIDHDLNFFGHNNIIDNNLQVSIYGQSPNSVWDNGYVSGGNYWSDYNGTDVCSGPHQNMTGSDGIGDTPYVIDANNQDNYPLMNPYNTNSLSLTISYFSSTLDVGQFLTFTSNVSGGTLPYSYQWFLNGTVVPGADFSRWNFTPTSAGSYTIYANVTDSIGGQATSNTATVTVNLHAVAVTNVTPSKGVIGQGFSANISVTVANSGNYQETFNLTLYATIFIVQQNGTLQVASQNVTLENGNCANITFVLNTASYPYGNYTMSAYALLVPGETNTASDNCTCGWVYVSIIGDITGGTPNLLDFVSDGKVDMKDIGLVARYFGESVPPAPSNCDITGPTSGVPDGKIDMRDIGLVARHFGQHYP